MQFLDEVKIYIKSGDGGPGCVSFRREKNIPFGGPNGGDGGRGGDVEIECVGGLNTLIDYRYKQHFKSQNGEHGKGKNRNGASREPLALKVPVGTQIFDEYSDTLLHDFTEIGQKVTILKGGDGGIGNAAFKSATNRAPRKFTIGWPGEEMWIWMRLKLISDAGLVGLPNAGKSTFLSKVTAAKPKIADYPFTTLKPQLGVVYVDETEFVLADIPGLIEDAHLGAGLGDKFLKHLERCGVLLHLIDGTAEDILNSYHVIRGELEAYSPILATKTEIVALNKCDMLSEEEIEEKMAMLKQETGKEVYRLSTLTGENVAEILRVLRGIIDEFREIEQKIEINSALDNKRKKLLYRSANRGTKETDLLLGEFAKKHIEILSPKELDQFDELLNENDVDIFNWISDIEEPAPKFNNSLFAKIQRFKFYESQDI